MDFEKAFTGYVDAAYTRSNNIEKWDKRFLRMAEEYGSWSKDPSTKIGAIAVNPVTRAVLSGGYNGFPRGIKDTPERLNIREVKYQYVVHAEMNVIYNATSNGISLNGSTLYCAGLPTCASCALGIIQVGIKRVVIGIPDKQNDTFLTWKQSWEFSKSMFEEANVMFKIYNDWKEECTQV